MNDLIRIYEAICGNAKYMCAKGTYLSPKVAAKAAINVYRMFKEEEEVKE